MKGSNMKAYQWFMILTKASSKHSLNIQVRRTWLKGIHLRRPQVLL